MNKNITNKLMTQNFWWICLANALLYVSAYMLLPLLPFAMCEQTGIPVSEAASLLLAFAAGMFIVGPFHAYLGDAYKRKHVLIYSMLLFIALLILPKGGTIISLPFGEVGGAVALAFIQGAGFGLAATAGITVAIDITVSERRSAGNMVYAWAARMGMLIGVALGAWLCKAYGFQRTVYVSVIAGLAGCLFASQVFVAFRAPIGTGLLNLDRFLLPRAWVPVLNVLLMAFAAGVLLPLLPTGNVLPLFALAALVVSSFPFTQMFVKLSHHCQRGTANTTLHLAMDTGTLLGLYVACRLMDEEQIYETAAVVVTVALLFYLLLTRPYYKKKRVR